MRVDQKYNIVAEGVPVEHTWLRHKMKNDAKYLRFQNLRFHVYFYFWF